MNHEYFQRFFGVFPTVRDVPKFRDSPPLSSVISERVKDIVTKHDDIFLLWSGGIDSTLAFYALAETGICITVVYNENSLSEYPKLGRQLLDGEFKNVTMLKTKEFTSDIRDLKPTVTGELGDQMIGSATFSMYNQEQRLRPYKEVLPTEIVEGFDDIVKKSLCRETFTTGEYLWALNFIFKYKDVVKRIDTEIFFKGCRLVHFFECEEFEIWAINNYKTNSSYDKYKEYKMAYKDYIFSQNGDKIYRDHKTKIPSLRRSTKD